jgi:cyclopropane fatty-acyl-phospholipid synthase-like methyltransferase
MTVLEPGCGMGYFSLPIARMVGPDGRLLCVDVEPRALQRLERRARRAGVADRITVSTCGPTRLGLEGHVGQVDLTLVMHALHELEDLPGFLDQIRALLRPDGRMFVVEPDGHVSPEQFDAMMACAEERGLMVIERPDVGRRRLATLLGRRG